MRDRYAGTAIFALMACLLVSGCKVSSGGGGYPNGTQGIAIYTGECERDPLGSVQGHTPCFPNSSRPSPHTPVSGSYDTWWLAAGLPVGNVGSFGLTATGQPGPCLYE